MQPVSRIANDAGGVSTMGILNELMQFLLILFFNVVSPICQVGLPNVLPPMGFSRVVASLWSAFFLVQVALVWTTGDT